MKEVLTTNVIEAADISADEEDVAYPVENVLDLHPKLPWKATSADAVVTVLLDGGQNTIALYGVEATEVIFSLYAMPADTLIETVTYNMAAAQSYHEMTIGVAGYSVDSLYIPYTYQESTHKITLEFTATAGTVVQVGIIMANIAERFQLGAKYGLTEGLKDYSITKELANGSTYLKKRDIVRTFSGSVQYERHTEFYKMMRSIAQTYGETPMAWKLTGIDNQTWTVFARLDGMPSGTHNLPSYSDFNFKLVEVI